MKTVEELAPQVAQQVKTGQVTDYITGCTQEAAELVAAHIAGVTVPDSIHERAIIETAADLFWRRNAQNGIAQFDNGEGLELMRIGADPLHAARILLKPWTGVPIA